MNLFLFIVFLLNITFFSACTNPNNNINDYKFLNKNIILLVGDGMGVEHLKAARWNSVGKNGILNVDKLEDKGYIITSSANSLITDSAAAATAMATGVKTNNGIIGKDPSFNNVKNILEYANASGKSVGLVTNVQISHATPAGFGAHTSSRTNMTEIALQFLENNITVLLGGGEDEFLPSSKTGCYPELGERDDGRDLIQEAVVDGYTYICDNNSLNSLDINTTSKLLGLFSDEEILRGSEPTLEIMTKKAIEVLSKNPNGFFLMIESGQIDWAAHANDATNVIYDVIELDDLVGVIQDKYLNNETLFIVTADHETGGMEVSLNSSGLDSENGPFYMPDNTTFYVNWTTDYHTATNVKIWSNDVENNPFTGTHENTYIFDIMKQNIEAGSN